MESLDNASKEELLETIESLKEENSKIDDLTQKLRELEGEQLKSSVSTVYSCHSSSRAIMASPSNKSRRPRK